MFKFVQTLLNSKKLILVIFICSFLFAQNNPYKIHSKTHEIEFENSQIKNSSLQFSQAKRGIASNNLTLITNFEIAYIWLYNELGYDLFDVVEDSLLVLPTKSRHPNY